MNFWEHASIFIMLCSLAFFRQNFRIDESKLMHKYLIIGYGIPALLVLIGNVHIYGYHRVGKNSFEVSCNDHRKYIHNVFRFFICNKTNQVIRCKIQNILNFYLT